MGNGHPLETIHAEFLQLADEDERNFIEANDEWPEILFLSESLSLRYSMYLSLQGEIIGGEQEDFLYPQEDIAATLINSLDKSDREIVLEETTMRERSWTHGPTALESRLIEGSLDANDFFLFDGEWNTEHEFSDNSSDEVDSDLAHAILEEIRKQDPSPEADLLLKRFDALAHMSFWTNFSDFSDARIEFAVVRQARKTLGHCIQYHHSVFGNQLEHRKFEKVINDLSRDLREKIIPYLQRAESNMTEHREKNNLPQPERKMPRWTTLLSNIRLGKLPLKD